MQTEALVTLCRINGAFLSGLLLSWMRVPNP
jgi:hypothetical protein